MTRKVSKLSYFRCHVKRPSDKHQVGHLELNLMYFSIGAVTVKNRFKCCEN